MTNPYTKGLKELMQAFITVEDNVKNQHFIKALKYLFHIKYYYLEALFYYCLFLKEYNPLLYKEKVNEGLEYSNKFYYQYLNHQFSNIDKTDKTPYVFSYDYYPVEGLKEYVESHNNIWEKKFKEKNDRKNLQIKL